jgi:hypothetical protein
MTQRMWRLQGLSLLALVTGAVASAGACADPNGSANAPQGSYSAPANSGYPPQPGQPPAYPQQPGYPPAPQAAYPQPPGYPPQPAYPAPGLPPAAPQAQLPAAPPTAAPAASGSTPPLGPVVTNDPNQLSQIFAQAAQAAQAFLQPPGSTGGASGGGGGGGLPTSLADGCVKALALQSAQGMSPEGQEATGNLQEGGHLAFTVPMQGGKCYTLIGCSPPGQIKNLDLNLLAPPFYNVLAGQDTSDDNHPIIGNGKPMCPIVPVALNYKVDIVARSGAGSVAVQLYSKSK